MVDDSAFNESLVAQAKRWVTMRKTLMLEHEQLAVEIERSNARKGEIEKELDRLRDKVAAAAVIVPEIGEIDDGTIADGDVALTDAILSVLRPYGPTTLVARDKIKRRLPSHGYPIERINANPDYLYIALKRLTDRGLIRKSGDNFSIAK